MAGIYVKSAAWDFLLVLAVATGLCYTLLNCFYIAEELQFGPVPAIACAAVLLALFAAASSARTLRIGVPLIGLALVALWIGAAATTPDGAYLSDTEQNRLIFAMTCTLCPLACYALSRRVATCGLLFAVGAFLTGLVQFLYQRSDTIWAAVFVAGSLALVVFKNYQHSLRTSTSVKNPLFAPGFAVAVAATAVAVGAGAGIWFGVIAPLDPPAAQVKLITEHRALETLRVKGVADIYQVPNLDMTSDQTNDGERTTDDIKESPDGREYPATGNTEAENDPEDADSPMGSLAAGINLDVPDDLFDFLNYDQVKWALLIAALALAAAIAAYFVGRRTMRARRLARIQQMSPADQSLALFPFFMGKFEKLGFAIAPGQTVADYARANAASMEQFDTMAGVPFADLASDYAAAAYGSLPLDRGAAERLERYYGAFWKASRRKLGNVRYLLKSFRL